MKTENLVINADGKELLLGAHFHTLEDMTRITFEAQNLIAFVSFVKKLEGEYLVICKPQRVEAWPKEINRYSLPLATCQLHASEALSQLSKMANTKKSLADFAEFIESFKAFSTEGALELLPNLRNFRMKKVLSVNVSDDRKGNFAYAVSLEKGGNDDFTPPALLKFKVPIFKFHADTFEHAFELYFDSRPEGETVAMNFTLKTFTFDEDLEAAKIEAIDAGLEGIEKDQILWGSQAVKVTDDSWKYKKNSVES